MFSKRPNSSLVEFLIVALAAIGFGSIVAYCSKPDEKFTPAAMPTKPASEGELEEVVATFLNLNGLLCARVTDIRPLKLKDTYEVTCIEYRGGSTKKTYILNMADGRVFEN